MKILWIFKLKSLNIYGFEEFGLTSTILIPLFNNSAKIVYKMLCFVSFKIISFDSMTFNVSDGGDKGHGVIRYANKKLIFTSLFLIPCLKKTYMKCQ